VREARADSCYFGNWSSAAIALRAGDKSRHVAPLGASKVCCAVCHPSNRNVKGDKMRTQRIFLTIVCGVAFSTTAMIGTKADPEECREAISQYNSAKSDIADALKRYASCVSDSDGHDDCSSEFSTLRSAQDDFESAVSDYESNCS
jgi:hypothetical protein